MGTERQWASKKSSGKEINFKFEEAGQELEAYYVGTLENQGSEKNSSIHTFKKENGEEVVMWGSFVMDDQLAKTEFGSFILIKYLGKEKSKKGGKQYHNFEVFVDESAEKIEAPAAAVKKESAPVTSTQEEEEEDDLPF